MPKKLVNLILHCTATPEGRRVYPSDIKDWHTWPALIDGKLKYMGKLYNSDADLPVNVQGKRGRGWSQVGYSDMITLDGALFSLTPNNNDGIVDPWEITNGVAGVNSISRHIVYVGGCDKKMKPKDTRTTAQKVALRSIVESVIASAPLVKVGGHYQFDKKKPYCPGFDVPAWLRSIGVKEQNIYLP
jgi:N-acetylmuramoyl-L-alanine amidase